MRFQFSFTSAVRVCVGAEPVPYIPRDAVKQALLDGPKLSRDVLVNDETTKSWTPTSLELMTLPVCLQFARTLGARSLVGRRMMIAEKQKMQQSRVAVAAATSRRSYSASEGPVTPTAPPADDGGAGGSGGGVTESCRSKRLTFAHSKRCDSLNI